MSSLQDEPYVHIHEDEPETQESFAQDPFQFHTDTHHGGAPDAEARRWGSFAHLSGLAGLLLPLGSIIAPYIIWKTKGEDSSWVAAQAKEAFNFQLSMGILIMVSAILCAILIGIPMLIFFGIAQVVMTIIAFVRASEGKMVKYKWFNMHLVK